MGKYQGITLANIGLGVAKNITSFWNYDKSSISESNICFSENEIDKQYVNYIVKDNTELLMPPYSFIASLCESEDAFNKKQPNIFATSEPTDTPRNGEKIGLPFLLNDERELILNLSFFDIYGRDFKKYFNVKVFGIVRGGSVNNYFIKMEFCEK